MQCRRQQIIIIARNEKELPRIHQILIACDIIGLEQLPHNVRF